MEDAAAAFVLPSVRELSATPPNVINHHYGDAKLIKNAVVPVPGGALIN